ncbi:MAG: hypothetical protein Q7T03_01765 [Deltaproteobacteria bacterium]|nr:hypothetical protein [Deltaproteobacteria bacterium]
MKIIPPTENHLTRLYYELGKMGAQSVGEKKPWPYHFENTESLFALASDLSRWDPRLLQILVEFGLNHWKELHPQHLREAIQEMQSPQTVGVVAAFILAAAPLEKETSLFWNYVTAGLKPVEPQFYFHDLHTPGSILAERAAKESLQEFSQWGFLGRERVIADTRTKQGVGSWGQPARLNILKRLFKTRKQIQISDYLKELGHSISRQQALLDLKKIKAKQEGSGRGTTWILLRQP